MPNFYEPNDKRFRNAFWRPNSWFRQYGDAQEVPNGDLLVHQDNGKRILIVCHTDYVTPMMPYSEAQAAYVLNHPSEFPSEGIFIAPFINARKHQKLESQWVTKHAKVLDGPVVDDRLGCAIALGCSDWADLLFTDCEEIGKSTASFFTPPREYNWIVELDRKGTDVVTYQYQDKEWLAALKKHFTVGWGSFSDIGYMEGLGVSAVNVGIGYHKEHTRAAYWDPKETSSQLGKLRSFLGEFGDTAFAHKPAPVINYRANRHNHQPWRGADIAPASHLPVLTPRNDRSVITQGGIDYTYLGGIKHYWSDYAKEWIKCIQVPEYNDYSGYMGYADDYSEEIEACIAMDWLEQNHPDAYRIVMEIEEDALMKKALTGGEDDD